MAKPSLLTKLLAYLRSPQGRSAIARAQQAANRPEVRNKATGMMRRLFGSRH